MAKRVIATFRGENFEFRVMTPQVSSWRTSFGEVLDVNPAPLVVKHSERDGTTKAGFARVGESLRSAMGKVRVRDAG
jgi:hypothetical protein